MRSYQYHSAPFLSYLLKALQCFPECSENSGPLFSGLVCHSIQPPVAQVCELEARSICHGNGCLQPQLAGPPRLCFPLLGSLSFHSAEVWTDRDSSSATMFCAPGRYSAESVIPLWGHHCHNWQTFFISFWEWVPPIMFTYETAVWLSIRRQMCVCLPLHKRSYSKLPACSSSELMWCCCSCGDHNRPVLVPMQVAPQPIMEASVSMMVSGGGALMLQSFQELRCLVHHSRSCLTPVCNVTTVSNEADCLSDWANWSWRWW